VKLARLKRPKILCSPSYADFRPKTNPIMLLDMAKGRTHTAGHGKLGNPKLESV
jgi:hypothetical protein